jgi:fumarate reductase iron-sulfur subunit
MADTRTIEIEVFRYNPETDTEPHFQTFQVPFDHDTSGIR